MLTLTYTNYLKPTSINHTADVKLNKKTQKYTSLKGIDCEILKSWQYSKHMPHWHIGTLSIPPWILNLGLSAYSVQPPKGNLPFESTGGRNRKHVSALYLELRSTEIKCTSTNNNTHFTSFLQKPRCGNWGFHKWLSLKEEYWNKINETLEILRSEEKLIARRTNCVFALKVMPRILPF